ncbi:MAG TPA: hypothetical protein VF528_16920 [Pyrinomonadaceae bacterium]
MSERNPTANFGLTASGSLSIITATCIILLLFLKSFSLWSTMFGLIIIFLLAMYHSHRPPDARTRVALSAVWGMALIITTGVFINALRDYIDPRLATDTSDRGHFPPSDVIFFSLWIAFSVLAYLLIERLSPGRD